MRRKRYIARSEKERPAALCCPKDCWCVRVEESAAAAESLKVQALQLVQTVAMFQSAGTRRGYSTAQPGRSNALLASATGGAFPKVERRGPDRAKNVARLSA